MLYWIYITTRREFTLLKYSTTLSSLITSFCVIFDICNKLNCRSIYIPEYSQYWFQHAVLNVITTTWIYSIKVFYNTLKHNRIILYHIWYMQHDKLPFYIYSRILPVLISTCCIECNHYKTWIYSIKVFYNTLKLNHIILCHIWYLQ